MDVGVAVAEEVWVPVLIFLVYAMLKVYGREAAAVREGEECVSFGGRLTEALVCHDGFRGTCEVSYRHNSLVGCVGACLFVGEDVLEGGFVTVCLVGHRGGGGRGCLDVWGLLCWLKE